ncbi:hypothetical protein [Cohnella herbarum]|uniref:Lipoprotein n=1 Tax=Cohnella herbarum TaxID=2728023 RepID=A0A7Z2VKY3_9BACL|nr:hypothetical protein [Cohnella herbarum]QJD84977.1 hypothetical protein HH215_18515 [Cohnella herbarum]
MRVFKNLGQISLVLILMIVAASCSTLGKGSCNSDNEWADFLIINNITYYQNNDGTMAVTAEQLGDTVGKISYMLNDHACTGHVSKNGDAAFLPIGTVVYALKGYKSEFRVVANNKVYEVNDNPNAATVGDLMDIEGKVEIVSLESGQDGRLIGNFSQDASSDFISELLPLPYVGFDAVYETIKHEAGIFLRVHLQDGTSFRMVYYPKANGFSAGAFGTEKLKLLIMSQRQQIKAAAGL